MGQSNVSQAPSPLHSVSLITVSSIEFGCPTPCTQLTTTRVPRKKSLMSTDPS